MSNCFSEAEQLILPLDYPSEFSNLETALEQGSNTSTQKDEQPYICKTEQSVVDRCKQPITLHLIIE